MKKTYKGITTKNGQIYVRFKYLNVTYPIKNFTKLYGCTTESSAYKKLQEVKVLLSNNEDVYGKRGDTLSEYFYANLEENVKNGKWRPLTVKNYTYFFETVINNEDKHDPYSKNAIGHLNINKITLEHLEKIEKSISHSKNSWKGRLKQILSPLFITAKKNKVISENIVLDLKSFSGGEREKISNRAIDTKLVIVRKLYKAIQEYETRERVQIKQTQMFFLLVLMTAHRYGELLKLTKEDVIMEEKWLVSEEEIVKTKEKCIYPFPNELYEYFESIESGLLFPNLKHGSMYTTFRRIVKKSGIRLHKNSSISIHDTRSLMMSLMIEECEVDPTLADVCLEHSQKGSKAHYTDYTVHHKIKPYNKYWDLIRGKTIN